MANSYLSRTPSSTTNRRTYTFSVWAKFCSGNTSSTLLNVGPYDSSKEFRLTRNASGTLEFYDYNGSSYEFRYRTNRLFRDVSAWYHIVCAVDTTNGTSGDRVKIYVNGVQETSFDVSTAPSLNLDTNFNVNNIFYVGSTSNGNYTDGYLSHVALVDGQQLAQTVFGETDSTSGLWKFKSPSGVTWGTNGFHLKFENSGNLGLDSSGDSNTFTVVGNGRQALDTPSNVSTTLNSLSTPSTLSNGNTKSVYGGSGSYAVATSTLGMTTGKWYCEVKINANSNYPSIGVCTTTSIQATKLSQSDWLGNSADSYGLFTTSGNVYTSANIVNTFGAIATNDIIGMALDLDSAQNTLKYYKNGSLIGTQNITTNTDGYMFAINTQSIGGGYGEFDFGNGYFGTTAVSSAQNPTDGVGVFEYTPPTNYRALCTKSINAQEYS